MSDDNKAGKNPNAVDQALAESLKELSPTAGNHSTADEILTGKGGHPDDRLLSSPKKQRETPVVKSGVELVH